MNHASFVTHAGGEAGAVRLLADPWFDGRVFNEGWELLSPTVHDWEALSGITHLWFSHEHPDHFSPRALTAMPDDLRARVEVLYQDTVDHKVVDFCKRFGFAGIRQLEPGVPVELAPGVEIRCGPMHPADSWLAVRTAQASLLNVNDCELNRRSDAVALRDEVGPVDVLFTQFSIAAWDGNADQLGHLRARARFMLERIKMQVEVFEPRFVVPFASFVWFCHEENRFMNEGANRIGEVATWLRENVAAEPVVLYPGDRWRVGETPRSEPALERYARDYAAAAAREPATTAPVTEEELLGASRGFVEKMRAHSGRLRMRVRLARKQWRRRSRADGRIAAALEVMRQPVEPTRIFVTDLERAYLFDLDGGLRPADIPKPDCDIWIRSDSLHYAFAFLWGGDTLQINGRFHEVRPDSRLNLFEDFWTAKGLNAGDALTWSGLVRNGWQRLLGRAPDERPAELS